MTDIKHKRSEPFARIDDKDICQVELDGTDYIVKEKKDKEFKLIRNGDEKTAGFDISFKPGLIGYVNPVQNKGNPVKKIKIHKDQPITEKGIKYTISYPYDTEAIVAKLDPIIIIQPHALKKLRTFIFTAIVALVAGAWFGMKFF